MVVNHDPKMIGLWKVGRTLGRGFSGKDKDSTPNLHIYNILLKVM